MKGFWIAHPYLFALASLLFLYPFTAVVSSPGQLLRPLLAFLASLVLLAFVANRVARDREWAAIMLAIFVMGFYASRLFFYVAGTISVSVIALWLLMSFLRKRNVKIGQITFLLNAISVLLVFFSLVRIFSLFRQVPWANYQRVLMTSKNTLLATLIAPDVRPDIYYIVLDGYARSDILGEFYAYNNSDFTDSLKTRGFIVPEESRSNYPKTALSVTSMLNMNYISAIAPGLEDSFFWWLMSPLIDHSQTRMLLEKTGYQTISIATNWSITDNASTDIYFKPRPVHLDDFEGYLLEKTSIGVLKPIFRKFAYVPSFEAHRQLVEYNFEILSQIPEISGPKFIFAHILSPHPPFVFDESGNPLEPNYSFSFNDANDYQGTKEQYRNGYVGQLQYVNSRILQVVDDIIAKSETPPIIILQADHGPGLLTDFRSSENTCLKERFSVFAAYYLPGVDEGQVPDDLSAVNVFRLVLNLYFGAELPLLEDSFFYYKDTIYIYRAEDVTSQIDEPCEILP